MTLSTLIVQRRLTHYRVPLFERMRALLEARDVRLHLVYGQPNVEEASKGDSAELDWAIRATNTYIPVSGGYLCYQPLPRRIVQASDLVIITQESQLLVNYALLLRRQFSKLKIAMWGHGANLQRAPGSWREQFKRWYSSKVDWWFAYTELSREIMIANGFPPERITCVNNTIDTSSFIRYRRSLSQQEISAQRERLGLGGAQVGVFVGSLYAGKRLDLLQSAAEALRSRLPDFRLLVIGDGPLRRSFVQWAASRDWVTYLGPLTGERKILCLAVGDVLLNPGLVGLVVMDSFCGELPLVTTEEGTRAPESAYLKHGVNSLITETSLPAFTAAVESLLSRPDQLDVLRAGCRASAALYTIESMAESFSAGIVQALETLTSSSRSNKCA